MLDHRLHQFMRKICAMSMRLAGQPHNHRTHTHNKRVESFFSRLVAVERYPKV